MERGIAAQAAVSRTPNTDVICITDEDKDIVECNICCYNVTISTLIIQATGPKREYPDRGVNWGSTINKGHILNGLLTRFNKI